MNFSVRQEYRITLALFRYILIDVTSPNYPLWSQPIARTANPPAYTADPPPLPPPADQPSYISLSGSRTQEVRDQDNRQEVHNQDDRQEVYDQDNRQEAPRRLYRPYWILATDEVNAFISASVNR